MNKFFYLNEMRVNVELVGGDLVKSLAHIEHPALNISRTQTGKVPHSEVSPGWVLDRHFDVDTWDILVTFSF